MMKLRQLKLGYFSKKKNNNNLSSITGFNILVSIPQEQKKHALL